MLFQLFNFPFSEVECYIGFGAFLGHAVEDIGAGCICKESKLAKMFQRLLAAVFIV